MRGWMLLLAVSLTGCASAGAQPGAEPGARAIARIETGFSLLEDLQSVGVAQSEAMNSAARTQVRNIRCTHPEPARADCLYEAARQTRPQEWTERSRSFVRVAHPDPRLPNADGWTVVPASSDGPVP
jgi:hypothetical protein